MQQICLYKLASWQPPTKDQPAAAEELVRIDEEVAAETAFGLWHDRAGSLRTAALSGGGEAASISEAGKPSPPLAALRCIEEDGTSAWYAAVYSERLGINGTTPPLPLARLEPGALLSIDGHFWLVTSVWQPHPQPAPAEVAASRCPVCGGKLSEAPVVQCPDPNCGRWTHLERPDQPDSGKFLNCYLAAPECPECHHATTIDPALVPEPHEKVLPAAHDAPW